MSSSPVVQINIRKSHLAFLSAILLVATASATVNIRDPVTNIFGELNLQDNPIKNVDWQNSDTDNLDADTLDGLEPGEIVQAAGPDTMVYSKSLNNRGTVKCGSGEAFIAFRYTYQSDSGYKVSIPWTDPILEPKSIAGNTYYKIMNAESLKLEFMKKGIYTKGGHNGDLKILCLDPN